MTHRRRSPAAVDFTRAAPKTHPACVWLDARRDPSRGTCGSPVPLRRREQPQILRLRPTDLQKQRVGNSLRALRSGWHLNVHE